jgi:hypothetical protein
MFCIDLFSSHMALVLAAVCLGFCHQPEFVRSPRSEASSVLPPVCHQECARPLLISLLPALAHGSVLPLAQLRCFCSPHFTAASSCAWECATPSSVEVLRFFSPVLTEFVFVIDLAHVVCELLQGEAGEILESSDQKT